MDVTIGVVLFFCNHFFCGCNLMELMVAICAPVLVLAVEELIKVANLWQPVKVVFLWRAGGDPLETASIPRVERRLYCPLAVRDVDVDQEEQNAEAEHQGADRGDEIPETDIEKALTGPVLGPDIHASRLSLQPNDVHRPEGQVHSDDGEPEIHTTQDAR